MGRIGRAERVVRADAARVFAALVDGAALERWLPPTGMSGTVEHFDARPGGSYRMTLSYDEPRAGAGKATDATDVVEVRFVDIRPDTLVVQEVDFVSDDPAFAGTMTMTWTVEPVAGGARVQVRAEQVPPGIAAQDHERGMAESLQNLAAHLEGAAGV